MNSYMYRLINRWIGRQIEMALQSRAIVLGRGLPLGQLLFLVPGGLRPQDRQSKTDRQLKTDRQSQIDKDKQTKKDRQ